MAKLAMEVGGRGGIDVGGMAGLASGEGELVTRGEREVGVEGEPGLFRGGDGRGLSAEVGAGGEGEVFVGGESEEGFVWRATTCSEEGLEGGTLKGRWEVAELGGGEDIDEGGEGRCWISDEPFVELIMSVSNLLQAFANSSSGDFNESF